MTTILVIDDDESLRDTIGIMLEQEGFTPVLVADGKAGFERALLSEAGLDARGSAPARDERHRDLQAVARGRI